MNAVGDNLSATHQLIRIKKNSGIVWIGDIPSSWENHPVYYYFGERKNKNCFLKEQNLLSLSYGKIVRKDINKNGGLLPASFNTYNIVEAGDIIIRPTDLQNDKGSLRTGLVTERGIITSAYIDLKPIKNINSKYFYYLLHVYDIMKVFYNMGDGVRQGLNYKEFSKLMVFSPSRNEQDTIVQYLDTKCSEIDSICADILTEINTLEEYKKSIITETVTKGLQPDVVMKDSGVEWLGEIADCSFITKLKYMIKIKDGTHETPKYVDDSEDTVPLITGKYIDYEKHTIMYEDANHISHYDYLKINARSDVKYNDIIMPMIGTVGKPILVKETRPFSIKNIALFKTNQDELNAKYIYYQLYSDVVEHQFDLLIRGGVQNFISLTILSNLIMIDINSEKKREIVKYLDDTCNKIDDIISDKRKQIKCAEAYKKSLIYEYVTGKKTCTPCQQNENANDMLQENKS